MAGQQDDGRASQLEVSTRHTSLETSMCLSNLLSVNESVALSLLRVLMQWGKITEHPLPHTTGRCSRLELGYSKVGAMHRKIEKTGLPVRVTRR